MRPFITEISSTEADPIDEWSPADPTHFGLPVRVVVGADTPDVREFGGGDFFDVFVCTPSWLEEDMSDGRPRFLRHTVLVASWDWPVLREHLIRMFQQTFEADTWSELAEKLSRYGYWEFEDYRT